MSLHTSRFKSSSNHIYASISFTLLRSLLSPVKGILCFELKIESLQPLTQQLKIIYLVNVKVYVEGANFFENGLSDANSLFK